MNTYESEKRKRPEVKICGITKKEEAAYVNEAGADYAGFVFFDKSRRNISYEKAETIFPLLNANIKKVAVFVSPTILDIQRAEEIGIDILQIHGSMSEEIIKKSRHPIWRAINVKNFTKEKEAEVKELLDTRIHGIVLDGAIYGGGETFDWKENRSACKIRAALKEEKFILAGGLTAENVAEGISIFAPDIVDVSSGVECDDGIGKSREKITEFIRKVKNT